MVSRLHIPLTTAVSLAASVPLGWLVFREWSAYRELQAITSLPFSTDPRVATGADLVYFYSPGCQLCRHATPAVVQAAHENPGVRVVYLNVAARDFSELRQRLDQELSVPEDRSGAIPALFSRERVFVGVDAIVANVAREAHAAQAKKGAKPHHLEGAMPGRR
jgi:thiol-disulfide isomerase/thioredoxin